MKIRIALFSLVLAVAPLASAAAGCSGEHRQMSTSQCAEGQTWDVQSQTCVDAASS